jgi:hypothetical protein
MPVCTLLANCSGPRDWNSFSADCLSCHWLFRVGFQGHEMSVEGYRGIHSVEVQMLWLLKSQIWMPWGFTRSVTSERSFLCISCSSHVCVTAHNCATYTPNFVAWFHTHKYTSNISQQISKALQLCLSSPLVSIISHTTMQQEQKQQ